MLFDRSGSMFSGASIENKKLESDIFINTPNIGIRVASKTLKEEKIDLLLVQENSKKDYKKNKILMKLAQFDSKIEENIDGV